jgi:hypothetical protein
MADFPSSLSHKPVISCMGREAMGTTMMTGGALGGASALWPTANLALFIPFTITTPYLVRKVWWANGAAVNGTTDVGIYTLGGTLLTSSGATTQAGTTVIQSVTLGTAFLLTPGSYYMAMSASTGTTCQYFRLGISVPFSNFTGMAQMATAHALPAAATLATLATAYLPIFGIASTLTI